MTFAGKHLTKADVARREAIHAGECMACLQRGIHVAGTGVVQWHHTAGKQHHDKTCGLCCWHHMGREWPGWTKARLREYAGPSLAEGSKPFHDEFGSDAELLAMQNELLREAA